ncbi:MAG: hypothetical protein WED06_01120 [Candidatus Paceibacterota bacterium]
MAAKKMVKLLAVLFVILGQLCVTVAGQENTIYDHERQRRYEDYAILHYIWISAFGARADPLDLKTRVEVVIPNTLKSLKKFVGERPDSYFLDEAKLLIAEVNFLSGPAGSNRLDPTYFQTKFNMSWLEAAKPWLMDIINNHPEDRYFDIIGGKSENEFTAAIALWYLGAWNGDPNFLRMLILKYPTSKYGQHATGLLKQLEELERRKK